MTDDLCAVCGKGLMEPLGGFTYPRYVSHLDCVRQVADNWEAVWRGRLEQAEAEVAQLKWMIDDLNPYQLTSGSGKSWMERGRQRYEEAHRA